MKNFSDKLIIGLQLGGFFPALALLYWHHSAWAIAFVAAFGTHVAGDVLRIAKDGL